MHRRQFIHWSGQAAFSAFVLSACQSGASAENADPLSAETKKLMPRLMKDANVPGCSVALVRDGKMTWAKGFGIRDEVSKAPVDEHTIFEAASVSKTVFAYAVMKLCEKGTIALDTPLVQYTKQRMLDNDPRVDKITARHVLSHRSGFQDWRTSEEPLKIYFDPGTDFMYSGEGFYYLQSVITELTGKTNPGQCGSFEAGLKVCATDIADYMAANVLTPMQMNASSYIWSEALAKNQAQAHDLEGKLVAKPHQNATDMARYASAGGLLTSAKDYASFIVHLLDPKDNDPYRLNKNSVAEMIKPQIKLKENYKIDGASAWALGWAVQERPTGNVLVHSGGQAGFRSLTMVNVEKKSGFVMLTNGDGGGFVLYDQALGNELNKLL